MSTAASAVIDLVQERLNELTDGTATAYTDAQALAWLNQGQRVIAMHRPDASSSVVNLQLVQGVKQTLATGQRRLLGVTTNMGTGSTRGAHIDGPVEFNMLGRYDRTWATSANEDATVLEYAYNPEVPGTFYVNPPVPSTPDVYIEVMVATDPTDVAAVGNNISLGDIYVPFLVEWMLYCFWDRDDERSPNYARGQAHLRTFLQLLSGKTQADMAVNPMNLERGG